MGQSEQPPARKILVVDDDYFITDMLSSALREWGYTVDIAENARALSRRMESQPPDLIILDITLPGMDGTEIGQLLHGNPSTARIPVLILSGDRNLSQKASRAQVEDWLAKPVDLDILAAKLAGMLGTVV